MEVTPQIDKQLSFLSRYLIKMPGVTAETMYESLREEMEEGMFNQQTLDFMLTNIEEDALFSYEIIHKGRLPGLQ